MAELGDVAGAEPQAFQWDDENTLKFLDSVDDYMTLLDSLSSTLAQGWFHLAAARHSMGPSRINTALLNLKPHNAATQLRVAHNQDQPRISLCKWASCAETDSGETQVQDEILKSFESLATEDRGTSPSSPESQEKSPSKNLPALDPEKRVQRERLKSLAVFGTLVPQRLRDSQLSFEEALEILVEIANARSSILYAYDKLQQDRKRSEASEKLGKIDD